ncbi:MAG: Na+:solute symporter [Planctomycetota bacterium]|nr:Na+:solute symporter [Planctomycetota bacterium]
MPKHHLQPIDWIIIGTYLAVSMGIGILLARRAGSSTKEFFISGRNLPWWIAGTSMVATSFASDTPLLISGWVREHGLWFNWMWWCFGISHLLAVFYLARLWRRAGVTTDVELAELRYSGTSARLIRGVKGAYFAAVVNTIAMTWVLLGMSKILKVTLGVEKWEAVAICAGVAVLYAAISGFWGVVMTDLLQFVIAMVGSIALAVIAVSRMGGMEKVLEEIGKLDGGTERLSLLPPAGDASLGFFEQPIFLIAVLLAVQWWSWQNADGGGIIIQRMSACKDERHSVLATLWFTIAHYALRPWPWIIVALVSLVAMPELEDHEQAYPLMMVKYLPPGLFGLMIASLLGAFMSTIDSQLNLASAYFVNDVYRRFLWRDRTDRHYVLVARIATVSFMALAALLAWRQESISELFTLILALASGAGAVLLLRWFWWRVNGWSEMAAMLTSVVVAGSIHLFAPEDSPWRAGGLAHGRVIVATVGMSLIVWMGVTLLTPPVSMETLVSFYRKVRPPGFWGPVARAAGVTHRRERGVFLRFTGGLLFLFGLTFGIGKALLLDPAAAGVAFGASLLGLVLLWGTRRGSVTRVVQGDSSG